MFDTNPHSTSFEKAFPALESNDTTSLFKKRNYETLPFAPTRILVCRPNGRLGNTLLLTPLVQELEDTFPGAEIDVLSACPAAKEIFREYGSVRTIHQLPRLGVREPASVLSTFFSAAYTRYDLVIDPCPLSWSSRFWSRAMHSKSFKLGFLSRRKRANIDCAIPIENAPRHMAQYPVHLLRQATRSGSSRTSTEIPKLDIKLTASEREMGTKTLASLLRTDSTTRVVGLFLNATGAKRLPMDFWRELARRLTEQRNTRVIEIIPAHGMRNLAEMPGYFSTSVRRMASVIDATNCFISADCGVMHLGAATRATTIGLFNITDAAKYAPYGGRNTSFVVKNDNETMNAIVSHASS